MMEYFDNYSYTDLWNAVCTLNHSLTRGADQEVFIFIPSLIAYHAVVEYELTTLEKWALKTIKSAHYHVVTDGYYHIDEVI